MISTRFPRSGELRTQKLKSHLVRTQSLNVLRLKPGVGQYIAIHATLTARDFFLPYFHVPAGSPSRGGDVTVYVPDINQPSLPTPFYYVLVSVSVFMALFSCMSFHKLS